MPPRVGLGGKGFRSINESEEPRAANEPEFTVSGDIAVAILRRASCNWPGAEIAYADEIVEA
jgi:hypothetical protein